MTFLFLPSTILWVIISLVSVFIYIAVFSSLNEIGILSLYTIINLRIFGSGSPKRLAL